ncbi:MAG: 23S rRNA (guanosine(2251)-2'-O)-methyltransferase RlmB [Micrococcaceae bacterium]
MATSRRPGAARKSTKKGPTKGSGGQGRKSLAGRGPTPKAEDRTWHKSYKPAQQRNTRSRHKDETVAGRNPVVEALRADIPARALHMAPRLEMDERVKEALKIAAERGIPVMETSRIELDRMTNEANHQGIALQVPPYEYEDGVTVADRLMQEWNKGYLRTPPLLIALDSITDPRNLGAIIRSASAFDAHGVVVPARRSVGVTATAWKTSAGAAARVPVSQVSNLNNALVEYKKLGYFVLGLDGDGDQSLPGLPLATDPVCLVVGSEGKGLSRLVREHCDQIISIPIASEMESLNASMAVGISLYEIAVARSGGRGD